MGMITDHLLKDADAWEERCEALASEDQLQFVEETFDHPLRHELWDVVGDALVELELSVSPIKFAALVEKIRLAAPEFHRHQLPDLEDGIVALALFHDDIPAVQKSVAYYVSDPVEYVDKYCRVFRWICLYKDNDVARTMAEVGFPALRLSPDIMPGVERELGNFLLLEQYESLYARHQNGSPPDLETIANLQRQLYDDVSPDLEEFSRPLFAEKLGPAPVIDWGSDSDRLTMRQELYWHFLRYARDRYHIPFTAATFVWENYAECLESREHIKPEGYFIPTVDEVTAFLVRHVDLFSSHEELTVATVWGLPYVADFLRDAERIGPSEHQRLIEVANDLKSRVIARNTGALWRYDFVHRWTPPARADLDRFAEEAKMFAESLNMVRKPAKNADGIKVIISGHLAELLTSRASIREQPRSNAKTANKKSQQKQRRRNNR